VNKKERAFSALAGGDVDRPPFSFWYHFGLQHLPGRKHAEAEIDFFRAYDLDFLKVMSDYPYPLPEGLEAVATEDDWKRVEPLGGTHKGWSDQLTALSLISESISSEAIFIETIFSPWTTARRMAPAGALRDAIRRYPETLFKAMDAIATSLAAYAREAVGRGASGIFLSLGAANSDVMTAEEYRTWGRPFDLKVLESVGDAPFNVLHIHGNRIHFEEVSGFPASAFNWSHFATAPGLAEGRSLSGKTVMGGINEATASHVSAPEIAKQVEQTLQLVGPQSLIVTPGCSVPTDTPVRNLKAIEKALRGTLL
jgi:uroporphyrinogen decarboxylase